MFPDVSFSALENLNTAKEAKKVTNKTFTKKAYDSLHNAICIGEYEEKERLERVKAVIKNQLITKWGFNVANQIMEKITEKHTRKVIENFWAM